MTTKGGSGCSSGPRNPKGMDGKDNSFKGFEFGKGKGCDNGKLDFEWGGDGYGKGSCGKGCDFHKGFEFGKGGEYFKGFGKPGEYFKGDLLRKGEYAKGKPGEYYKGDLKGYSKGDDDWFDQGGLCDKGFGKDKGKRKGGDIDKGKSKGKASMKIAMGSPVYWGHVKSFDFDKKRGYIACPEVAALCGQDVYVFADVLARGEAGPGDAVGFFLHWSAKGQPQASSPLIRLAAADSFALKGCFKPSNNDKGHGFVTCEATKEYFGRDVYVNRDLAASLGPGATVAFNVYLNRDKMPNVDSLQAVEDHWEPLPGDLSESAEARNAPASFLAASKSNAQDKSMSKGCKGCGCAGSGCKWGSGKGTFMMDWDNWDESWDADWGSGWGGFDMDDWGKGGCCGDDDWNDMYGEQGGKDGCQGFSKLGFGGKNLPTPTGETFVGQVKSFNSQKNYGFILSEEISKIYGQDCFCHGNLLVGHNVGKTVQFEVGLNHAGQPQAISVISLSQEDHEPWSMEFAELESRPSKPGPIQPGPVPKRQRKA